MTEQQTAFNLRALIRSVMAEETEADPGKLADVVYAEIPASEYAECVRQMLRSEVRQLILEHRRTSAPAPEPVCESSSDGEKTKAPPRMSPKVRAIRDWQRTLRDRIHVDNGWKLLGDCTRDDLLFAANERHEIAMNALGSSQRYEYAATMLIRYDVATVADLPVDAQSEFLDKAAS